MAIIKGENNMNDNNMSSTVFNAAKWSTLTEIVSKLITPISSMILARLIAPEAFGIVATVTMILSFADIFKDAGFQKYLIQHDFKYEKEKYENANVAFITNLVISIILWTLIFFFNENLATLVGSPGLGIVIVISSLQLPLTAISSIQMALFQRDFNFKTLFLVRTFTIFIPLIITIPLALLGYSYWSIIIGNLVMQFSNSIILTVKSKWKPNFFFKLKILREMFSFSIWSLIEAISIWLTTWIDAFIITSILSQYYLGIYKTSITLVNSLLSIITAAVIPVLFSTLSRLQNKNERFEYAFFKFQRIVAFVVFPLGLGVFIFKDFVTEVLLGSQWNDASEVIGIWVITSSIIIIFNHFCSEVYRAKGRPKLSFVAQTIHLLFLIPTIIVSSKYGFSVLVYARSLVRFQGTLTHFIFMKYIIKFPLHKSFRNILPSFIATIFMGIIGYLLLKISDEMSFLLNIILILICIVSYLIIIFLFATWRKEFMEIIETYLKKKG